METVFSTIQTAQEKLEEWISFFSFVITPACRAFVTILEVGFNALFVAAPTADLLRTSTNGPTDISISLARLTGSIQPRAPNA